MFRLQVPRPEVLRCGVFVLLAALAWAAGGCTPRHYRVDADAETYKIVANKAQHPQWWTPPFSIQPPPQSRNFDPYDPDRSPMPPDDPTAHRYMHLADGRRGYAHWHARGDAPTIEAPHWLASLELNEDDELQLDSERAVELGLVNSREYQFELENLYLTALDLSLERFEFQVQWFGTSSTFYEFVGNQISGRPAGLESNTLTTSSNLGFTRAFTTGGQLLVDFANTFVWEFTGDNTSTTFSTLSVNLVQPLLRGAFREVRMEGLTQSERNVLYAARDYARFRKQFYFDVVSGGGGYLSLLLQLQQIRNLETNLESLQQNLREHEALAEAGLVSPLQVDQVFQSFQSGRLRLIRARNDLQTTLDRYKVQLGLPPELDVQLDDSLLDPFELNSPEVAQLQAELDELLANFRELDEPPDVEELREGFASLQRMRRRLLEQREVVAREWQQWQELDLQAPTTDREQEAREDEARRALKMRLDELHPDLVELGRAIEAAAERVSRATRQENWEAIQRLARSVLNEAGGLFVIQSQVRAYLIQLDPVGLPSEQAVDYALFNRLDLMNRQGQVVDAWRKTRVAADALEADLDVVADAELGTIGDDNPVRFSSDASRFRVGMQLDSPLNRKLERNIYRTELIEYQRERRRYINSRDSVVQAVRLDLRELEADRLNFEIARQSLIAAARQVELARLQLQAPGQAGDSSVTQDLLNALTSLLDAKNTLIGVWVSYETNRLQLLLDTEALQLNDRGLLQDDDQHDEPDDPDPLPPPVVSERVAG